jgi:TRAP-type mannitol/chloroaromatic compound transport system permease large subunit
MPIVQQLGYDPVWFGVVFTLNMEIGYITPPFGFNLFYMKGVTPPHITLQDIYKSIVPFLFLELIGLALIIIFPQIVLWLPKSMGG